MNLKVCLLSSIALISGTTETLSQEDNPPRDTFQCIVEQSDGSYAAQFETEETITADFAERMHEGVTIIDQHTYLYDEDALNHYIELNRRFGISDDESDLPLALNLVLESNNQKMSAFPCLEELNV